MAKDFEAVFERLRDIYRPVEPMGIVTHDEAGKYYLTTHGVRARDGYRLSFGGVEINKSYVSAHLMPVYVHPDLLDAVSPALRKRMQGKSCFNFREVDEVLFAELAQLINASAKRFEADGYLRLTKT